MAKETKKAAAKKASKSHDEESVLTADLDSQEGVVNEIPSEDEDSDVIVAHPRVAGELRVRKLAPAPEKKAAVKETSRASQQPAKADFDAAHKALDLARDLSEREVAKSAEGDARMAKRKLADAPTTKFMVPFDIGEKHGAVVTVTVNGYRLSIKKGVLVEIPVPVAELLMKHLDVRSDVAEKFALHRDEATEEALS